MLIHGTSDRELLHDLDPEILKSQDGSYDQLLWVDRVAIGFRRPGIFTLLLSTLGLIITVLAPITIHGVMFNSFPNKRLFR